METMWLLTAGAVLAAAVAGFLVGRATGSAKARITELEADLKRQRDEADQYKQEVETHFEHTATLFVSMAGSYKALFEHLSQDYEKLSDGSARALFRDRVSALLLENGSQPDRQAITTAPAAAADSAEVPPRAADAAPASAPAGQPAASAEAAEAQAATTKGADDGASTKAAEATLTPPADGVPSAPQGASDAPPVDGHKPVGDAGDEAAPSSDKPQRISHG